MEGSNSLDTIRCRVQIAWTPSDTGSKQPGHLQMQCPNSLDTIRCRSSNTQDTIRCRVQTARTPCQAQILNSLFVHHTMQSQDSLLVSVYKNQTARSPLGTASKTKSIFTSLTTPPPSPILFWVATLDSVDPLEQLTPPPLMIGGYPRPSLDSPGDIGGEKIPPPLRS